MATEQTAICYNCPPEWADWASQLTAIKADLGITVPFDNKNSGPSLAAMPAEKDKPVADVIRRHPQVERVPCGHLHRPTQVRLAGAIASTAPSTAHQVALDLRDGAPWAFVMEPSGYQIHMWRADSGVVSHTAVIGDHDGPYPFFKDGKLIDWA